MRLFSLIKQVSEGKAARSLRSRSDADAEQAAGARQLGAYKSIGVIFLTLLACLCLSPPCRADVNVNVPTS